MLDVVCSGLKALYGAERNGTPVELPVRATGFFGMV